MNIFDLMYEDYKLDNTKPIRLFEAFAGYGSQYMALKRLGVKVDVVGYSEIDKFAIQVYEALHGKHKNYGGIGSFDRLPPNIDICTWSFPCQDISLAGKQRGMEDGSRSNYGYVFLDTVEATPYHERPKVLLMENVKALFSEKFRDDWREIQLRLERMGYTNYADVLNAKDYGVAQNRERVFIVSILGEYNYTFPKPIPLTKRLKDYLEDEVDEKYYLSSKTIENKFLNYKGNHKKGGFRRDKIFIDNINRKEISQTITTQMDGGTSQYVADPFEAIIIDDVCNAITTMSGSREPKIAYALNSREFIQRGWLDECPTLCARDYKDPKIILIPEATNKVVDNLRIRKLTPREALRLMDVSEHDIDIILSEVSNTQAYKLAGNSIVVSVLEAIFRNLF